MARTVVCEGAKAPYTIFALCAENVGKCAEVRAENVEKCVKVRAENVEMS